MKAEVTFAVHGRDMDDIERQAAEWLTQFIGDRKSVGVRSIEYRNVEPISVQGSGEVALWTATVDAEVVDLGGPA